MKETEKAVPKHSKEHYFCPEVGKVLEAKTPAEAEKLAAKLENKINS